MQPKTPQHVLDAVARDFRTTFTGGRVLMTAGVAGLPEALTAQVLQRVAHSIDSTATTIPTASTTSAASKLPPRCAFPVAQHSVSASLCRRVAGDLRMDDYIVCVGRRIFEEEARMAWDTPILTEICIGLEINGYLPAEF